MTADAVATDQAVKTAVAAQAAGGSGAPTPIVRQTRSWRTAFKEMGKLLSDPNDTAAVFRIMHALNAGKNERNYQRLIGTLEGGRIAYSRVELIEKLTDKAWVAQFAPGTVGATYRAFLERTGYSADGLAAVGDEVHGKRIDAHPYAWFGRRERDLHDIWHVLTGYQADDPLGELCLVAFSYAQIGGLGWGFIATVGALKNLREPGGRAVLRAVWEGYRHGQATRWLHLEDIEVLFAEPLEAARARLGITKPVAYDAAKAMQAATGFETAAA
ncbi:MAG TPA: Coq4 family protein [Rhizomicrobium sp.]|jgi:ubiquinone biosynthesis protein COQ4|nr:Coq4 family protein [Rhizomicrobium sp.]